LATFTSMLVNPSETSRKRDPMGKPWGKSSCYHIKWYRKKPEQVLLYKWWKFGNHRKGKRQIKVSGKGKPEWEKRAK